MNVNGLKSYNSAMSQALTQSTRQIFDDVRKSADSVDNKKQQLADQSLKSVQDQNSRAEQRSRLIDTYA
ncbi:hypothetical protein ABWL39_09330 [Chitinivorax sp. PXF-14]|uniref:hypothetical protein n=1 Tax=Chitinivorax sp. PXF-14 TaxID=3230488 RepID=UPI003466D176